MATRIGQKIKKIKRWESVVVKRHWIRCWSDAPDLNGVSVATSKSTKIPRRGESAHHVPQDGVLQGGVAHHEVQGVGARYGVKLRLALRHVQLKLVEVLAVGLCHKHDLLARLLVEQSDKSLEKIK